LKLKLSCTTKENRDLRKTMLALQKDAKLSFNELKKNHDNIVDSIEKRSRLIIGNLKKQYEDELSNFREENSKLKAKITHIEDKLW
jgi:F0F1-type ATP synthase membrane subunit b/b'